MTEQSYAAPSSTSESGYPARGSFKWATGVILLVLALAMSVLRLYRLSELPVGIDNGEGANAIDALRVLQGEHAVFFHEKIEGREGMIMYAMALAIALLGRTELALHLPTALASAGSVFAVFWLGRVLFGKDLSGKVTCPWRGLLIGGVGAGLMAASLGQTIIGRTAFRPPFLPLFLTLCFVLLWEGWTLRSKWRVVLAGVCAGLLPYTYIPARFTPFLFLLFGLSFVLTFRRGNNGAMSVFPSIIKTRVRKELPLAAIFAGAAAIVAMPILLHFALNPEQFFSRSGRLSVFDPAVAQGGPLGAFLSNVWNHLLAFGFRGDLFWRHNFAGQPMLNSWEAFSFWLGVCIAAWSWQRPAYRLLLLWLGVMLVPAMLSTDKGTGFEGPNTLRMIGAVPAVYILIGVAMWWSFRFLRSRCRERQWCAKIKFWGNEYAPAIAASAVVVGLILIQGGYTYRTYFGDWAAAPEVFPAYDQEWAELARVMNAQSPAAEAVYLIPFNTALQPYGFHFLYKGAAPAHVTVATTAHNLAQKIESALASEEEFQTVNYVDWNDDRLWIENGDKHLAILLNKHGRYLGTTRYPSFQIHRYTDVVLDRPWAIYDHLEPLTVHYDGGISLLGFALGQGEEQLSTRQIPDLPKNHSFWLALRWRTATALDIDYAASLRLHNADGGTVFQQDVVLKNSSPAATSHWNPDEPVDTLFYFKIPTGLTPGEYDLRLIVYDFDSLKPTVELGVWEPEYVLARLRLDEPE